MIETQTDWALTPADETQIAQLLRRCFTTDFGGRSYFQQRPHLRLIWREDGRILGHMAVMFRAIRLAGVLVDVSGLADVATDPDHRGKGIAQALLTGAIQAARAGQAQHFLLFGTAKIYAANGFDAAQNPITYVDMHGAVTGAVTTQTVPHLRVLPLKNHAWPATAAVDLLGPLF